MKMISFPTEMEPKYPAVINLEDVVEQATHFFRGLCFEVALVPLDGFIVIGEDEKKLANNMELISTKKTMPPIICTWHSAGNTWIVLDGHHRVRVCRKLGYTHVPACINIHSGFKVIVDQTVIEEQKRLIAEALRNASIPAEKKRIRIIEYIKEVERGEEVDTNEIEKEGILTCKKCKRPLADYGGLHCLTCENVGLGFYGVEPKQQ
jgi:hypothetical protein